MRFAVLTFVLGQAALFAGLVLFSHELALVVAGVELSAGALLVNTPGKAAK